MALAHDAVGAQALAGGDQQDVARRAGCRPGAPRSLPSAREHGGAAAGQRQQRLHRLPGAAARAPVEIAADQQEEEQRDRRIEIGVLLRRPRLRAG